MGYALAKVANRRGAEVTLVSGPTFLAKPFGVKQIKVTTAQEMHQAVTEKFTQMDAVVMAAAVSDYRPKEAAAEKVKKSSDNNVLELERTEDILLLLGQLKKGQVLIGFAAETENLLENAKEKLQQKNLDFIVANDLTVADAGFGSDTNEVAILWPGGKVETLPLESKDLIAMQIWNRVERLLQK
jgi:phosphopantothenoylcysteine decarboxylase/phosphopantothenate--cysteine ligase